MDRVRKALVAVTVLAMIPLATRTVAAGTVFFTPPASGESGDGYPSSRFGQPPSQVDTGVDSGYASRAAKDMDNADSDGTGGRSPASLQFDSFTGPAPIAPTADQKQPAFNPEPTQGEVNRKGIQEVALIAGDLGFFPKVLFVSPSVPIRLFVTGSSKNTLCIMMDSFQVRKQVRSQKIEEILFTANTPGKYRFYCPVNGMEGTLVVREVASPQQAAN